jgi:hypothetical protein
MGSSGLRGSATTREPSKIAPPMRRSVPTYNIEYSWNEMLRMISYLYLALPSEALQHRCPDAKVLRLPIEG